VACPYLQCRGKTGFPFAQILSFGSWCRYVVFFFESFLGLTFCAFRGCACGLPLISSTPSNGVQIGEGGGTMSCSVVTEKSKEGGAACFVWCRKRSLVAGWVCCGVLHEGSGQWEFTKRGARDGKMTSRKGKVKSVGVFTLPRGRHLCSQVRDRDLCGDRATSLLRANQT